MTDGDLTLSNSSVICTYLDRKYPQPALYPQDIVEQAHTLWFEEYATARCIARWCTAFSSRT